MKTKNVRTILRIVEKLAKLVKFALKLDGNDNPSNGSTAKRVVYTKVMLPTIGGNMVKAKLEKTVGIKAKNISNQKGYIFKFTIKNGIISIQNRKNPECFYDFVITNDGELRLGSGDLTLSGGAKTVKGAGKIHVNAQGKIDTMLYVLADDTSAYLPTYEEVENQATILKESGLTSDDFHIANFNS